MERLRKVISNNISFIIFPGIISSLLHNIFKLKKRLLNSKCIINILA